MVSGLASLWQAERELDSYWRNVYFDASFMWSGATEWNANMQDLKRRIDELEENGRIGRQVIEGKLSPDQWKNIHRTLWDGVSGQAKINGSAASVWSDFIVPSWTNVTDYAKDAKDVLDKGADKLDFFTSPVGLLLVFGILLMLVVWKIA